MAALAKIAERHPRLKLHIDHLGRSGRRHRRNRRRGLRRSHGHAGARASTPTSGSRCRALRATRASPIPYKNIHGYLRQIFEAFGPERSFWGTDITRMPCSYRQCVTMFTEELPWLKGRDLERVMGGAVVDWLGWKRPDRLSMASTAEPDPASLIEAYFERGWTDGLPVVPPTREVRRRACWRAPGCGGDEILGEIPGRNTVVVAEKVAINAAHRRLPAGVHARGGRGRARPLPPGLRLSRSGVAAPAARRWC